MDENGQEVIESALWQLSGSQNDIDTICTRAEKEALKRELKQCRKEVAVLKKELKSTKIQLRERKECTNTLARRLNDFHCEIEHLKACEDEWLRDLERQVMRPVIGVEVQEHANPDGSASLLVTAVAQKGTAFKAGAQVGDVIIKFGKADISCKRSFAEALLASPIGSKQLLQVVRKEPTPTGKPCTSVENLHVLIAGAAPSGFSLDFLRNADDPEAMVVQLKQGGARALHMMASA